MTDCNLNWCRFRPEDPVLQPLQDRLEPSLAGGQGNHVTSAQFPAPAASAVRDPGLHLTPDYNLLSRF